MMGQFRNLVKQMSDDELHEAGIYLTQQLTKKEDFVEVSSNKKPILFQGRLKIWTEHSTLILLISIPFEVAQQKFRNFYN